MKNTIRFCGMIFGLTAIGFFVASDIAHEQWDDHEALNRLYHMAFFLILTIACITLLKEEK